MGNGTTKATILVIRDLSAAFDMVYHDILLSVLNRRFGFQGTILNWVESYLCPRHFKVCIGDTKSDLRQLKQLVPQGSVGGPNLFNFYCGTITLVIPEDLDIDLVAFADDHNLRKTFQPSVPDMEKESLTAMELCLDNIIEWMNMNQLKINPTKTELKGQAPKYLCELLDIHCSKNCNFKESKILSRRGHFIQDSICQA